eukprot:1674352-Rhodomonas_salina.2
MSQPHVDHAAAVTSVVDVNTCALALRCPIARPDENVLIDVIGKLNIQQTPYPELTLFMRSCFRAFPQKNLKELTLLKYMQLYMACYQHSDLWKTCWVAVYPLLSYQVIKDVEEFVKKTQFNERAFVDIMLTE